MMKAKVQHIAIATRDPDATAEFYCRALGLQMIGRTDSSLAEGVFLSDGHMNIALLKYKSDEAAGRPGGTEFEGLHHIGFAVPDLEASRAQVLAAGATLHMEAPKDERGLYVEVKFRDPEGLIFDISERGWATKGGDSMTAGATEQGTVEMLDAFLDAWNAHDVDRVMSFMTDDCVFEASFGPHPWGQRFRGRAEVREGVASVFKTVPDIHWQKSRHFVAGEHGVSEWVVTGTRADGSKINVLGCDIFTFRDGKIASKRAYRKSPR